MNSNTESVYSLINKCDTQNKYYKNIESIKIWINPRPIVKINGEILLKDRNYDKELFAICDCEDKECSSKVGSKLKQLDEHFISAETVFPQQDKNKFISQEVDSIMDLVNMGYNCSLVAYGYSSSGKSYSINLIIARIIEHLQVLEAEKIVEDLKINTAFIECNFIGNSGRKEKLINMLEKKDINNKEHQEVVRECNEVKISFNSEKRKFDIMNTMNSSVWNNIDSKNKITKLYDKAIKNRHVVKTNINPESSRSHMVTWLKIEMKIKRGHEIEQLSPEIQIIDLAGQENISESQTSCGGIGLSLMAIRKMFNQFRLGNQDQMYNQRDSKIQQLLYNNLRSNSINVMLLCLNPTRHDEYLHILDSARTFKNIERTPLKRNRVVFQDEKVVVKDQVDQGLNKALSDLKNIKKEQAQLQQREQQSKQAFELMQQEYEDKLREQEKKFERMQQNLNPKNHSEDVQTKVNQIQSRYNSMIVGQKALNQNDLVSIQEEIMEISNLIKDDNHLLINLNELQDCIENKQDMQVKQADKIKELANSFGSQGIQIDKILDPKALENLQNLCGNSFNLNHKSNLNSLISKQPASFKKIVDLLKSNHNSIDEFIKLRYVYQSLEYLVEHTFLVYEYWTLLLRFGIAVDQVEDIFLNQSVKRCQDKLTIIEDIIRIMQYEKKENREYDSQRIVVIEYMSELMRKSSKSQQIIFASKIISDNVLYFLEKSSERLQEQKTVWFSSMVINQQEAYDQYFSNNDILKSIQVNQLINNECKVREKSALVLSQLLIHYPSIQNKFETKINIDGKNFDIQDLLKYYYCSTNILKQEDLLYQSGLLIENLVFNQANARIWLQNNDSKQFDVQIHLLQAILAVKIRLQQNSIDNITSDPNLLNNEISYKYDLFSRDIRQNENQGLPFLHNYVNQYLEIFEDTRIVIIMQKLRDNFNPSAKIFVDIYQQDDPAFKTQYIIFDKKINQSIFCDKHWTQSQKLSKGKYVIVIGHNQTGRDSVLIKLGISGDKNQIIYENEKRYEYSQVWNVKLNQNSDKSEQLIKLHNQHKSLVDLYPEPVHGLILIEKNEDLNICNNMQQDNENSDENENQDDQLPISEFDFDLRNTPRARMDFATAAFQTPDNSKNINVSDFQGTGNFQKKGMKDERGSTKFTNMKGEVVQKCQINKAKEKKYFQNLQASLEQIQINQVSNHQFELITIEFNHLIVLKGKIFKFNFSPKTIFMYNSNSKIKLTIENTQFNINPNQIQDVNELQRQFYKTKSQSDLIEQNNNNNISVSLEFSDADELIILSNVSLKDRQSGDIEQIADAELIKPNIDIKSNNYTIKDEVKIDDDENYEQMKGQEQQIRHLEDQVLKLNNNQINYEGKIVPTNILNQSYKSIYANSQKQDYIQTKLKLNNFDNFEIRSYNENFEIRSCNENFEMRSFEAIDNEIFEMRSFEAVDNKYVEIRSTEAVDNVNTEIRSTEAVDNLNTEIRSTEAVDNKYVEIRSTEAVDNLNTEIRSNTLINNENLNLIKSETNQDLNSNITLNQVFNDKIVIIKDKSYSTLNIKRDYEQSEIKVRKNCCNLI